ncbi:MAG: hypothetical protein E7613_02590 [Ruminococcaceae bacterium]|nr:hypothetical protein [Oscillospiraceae bacterium]
MKDVILTTDLYHKHADPNDHWNLANMYSLAYQGLIRFAGIMCDDDRTIAEDGSFLHFGDPSVQSVAQLNFITGMAVPVGIGSRRPIKKKEDLDEVLKAGDRISSVTLLLDTLQRSEDKVDIHMCGSCKDVLIAYKYAPELFEKKCDSIYLNAGTYVKQDPIEYNVSLEPYAYSQIFKIPCNIHWGPCFDELRHPFIPSKRATFYRVDQREILPCMSERIKKYFSYMYSIVFDKNWLTYLREPLEEGFFDKWEDEWCGYMRQMWSTPGFLLSAGKEVSLDGRIIDAGSEEALFTYKPIHVEVDENGYTKWEDAKESNVYMFENADPELYYNSMTPVIKSLFKALP